YVNNHLLGKFLENQKTNAFWFQTIMMMKRIEIYKSAEEHAKNGGLSIIDRSLNGDYSFALMQHNSGNISLDDWNFYNEQLENESSELREPDITIFLDVDPAVSIERLIRRGNESERKAYDTQYF